MESGSKTPDLIALVIVALIGVPIVYAIASAFADGEERRVDTPLRAFIGPQEYDALLRGDETGQHYLGNDRLAPDFELPQADGTSWRLRDHRGKVIVMNFWTVTCQPCVEEMPSLVSLARILEERGGDVELVTVSVDDDWDTVHGVVPADSALTVLLDADRAVVNDKFGTRLFPETWIIDRDGVIRLRLDGARDWSSGVAIDVIDTYL
jgi:peroxiredoxin